MINGTMATLDPTYEAEIVAALEVEGFRCVRDDKLMARVYGRPTCGETPPMPDFTTPLMARPGRAIR